MQQIENVTDDLRIYHLSQEEIEDPLLVFRRLFETNDLAGLRQLNAGLIREIMDCAGSHRIGTQDQMTFIAFSLQMGRTIEAVHLLTRRTQETDNQGSDLGQEHISHLSAEERQEPLTVLKEFISAFSLSSVRDLLSTMSDTCVTAETPWFAKPNAREDLLYVCKHIVKLFEAVYLIVREESHKQGKLVRPDFTPPANDHSNNA